MSDDHDFGCTRCGMRTSAMVAGMCAVCFDAWSRLGKTPFSVNWQARAESAEARLAEALAVIREVEWASELHRGRDTWIACPSCERIDPSHTRGMPDALRVLVGHAPDCRLRAVLGDGDGR